MLHVRKNLLKAFVLLALTPGLTTDLNAQAEEKQSITVGFNPTTGFFQQLSTERPAAQDVRTTHNVPLLNKQVEFNWSQLGNGGMALASLFYAYNHSDIMTKNNEILNDIPKDKFNDDEKAILQKVQNICRIMTSSAVSAMITSALIFGYKYAIGEQKIPFRVVNQQAEASSQEA